MSGERRREKEKAVKRYLTPRLACFNLSLFPSSSLLFSLPIHRPFPRLSLSLSTQSIHISSYFELLFSTVSSLSLLPLSVNAFPTCFIPRPTRSPVAQRTKFVQQRRPTDRILFTLEALSRSPLSPLSLSRVLYPSLR